MGSDKMWFCDKRSRGWTACEVQCHTCGNSRELQDVIERAASAATPEQVVDALARVEEWLSEKRWARDTRTIDDIAMPDDGSLMLGDLRTLVAFVKRGQQ